METRCIKTRCIKPEKDPLGTMLLDYLKGDKHVFVQVESSLLDMSCMTGEIMFRDKEGMSSMELKALELCRGRILDVGAGSGCHSLVLQNNDQDVTALDISPGCLKVMEKRGVQLCLPGSVFAMDGKKFDTLLMLMNGMGICGSIEGLNIFFQVIRSILKPGGQVIADSTDLAAMYGPMALIPGEEPYFGETDFTMTYRDMVGDPFEWLYIDYATLEFYARFHGWKCEKIFSGPHGKYLVRIY